MPALTTTELDFHRGKHPHVAKIYMSRLFPDTVYVGTVNGTHARGSRVITVSDISGDISNIDKHMTAVVGTEAEDDSVSRRRFRSRSGQDLTFDENTVVWENGQFITVYENWELWPRFPWNELTDPYTRFIDRDVAYTDQNEFAPPVPIMGPDRAGTLGAGSVSFTLYGLDSYAIAPGATISSYLWECSTGNIASPTSGSTSISFTTVGAHWVSLTVTDSNGKTKKTRRLFIVSYPSWDANSPTLPSSDKHAFPFVDFAIDSPITMDWQGGGARSAVTVFGDQADLANFQKRSTVIIWADMKYDGQVLSEPTPPQYRKVLFAGHIREETVERDISAGTVGFNLTTVDDLLRRHNMFTLSISDVDESPENWGEYKNLTVARAVHHLLEFHTTLIERYDVFLPIDNTIRLKAVDDFANGSVYDMIDMFTRKYGIVAHLCSNRQSRLHLEVNIDVLGSTDRAAKPTVMDVTERDRRGEVDISFRKQDELQTSLVTLSGTLYEGAQSQPFWSKAPGDVPHVEGAGKMGFKRQALAGQDDANERSGRFLAISNNPIKDIKIPMAGMYTFMDVVPQEWYTISLDAGDTKRGIVLDDQKIVPRTIVYNVDVEGGYILVDAVYDAESEGPDGITWLPPEDPGDPPPPPNPDDPPAPPPAPIQSIFWSGGACQSGTGSIASLGADQSINDDMQDINGGSPAGSGTRVIARLTSTKFVQIVVVDSASWDLVAHVCTVDGDTITVGAASSPAVTSFDLKAANLYPLGDDGILLTYIDHDGTGNFSYAIAGTVSGTTISWGTPVQLYDAPAAGARDLGVALLGTSEAVVATLNDDREVYYHKISITGTTIVEDFANAETDLEARSIGIDALSPSYLVLAYEKFDGADAGGFAKVITIDDVGFAFGTPVQFTATNTTPVNSLSVAVTDTTHFVISYSDDADTLLVAGATSEDVVSAFGTTLTVDDLASATNVCRISNCHVLVAHIGADMTYTLYGLSGTTLTELEQQVATDRDGSEHGVVALTFNKAISVREDVDDLNAHTVNVTYV